MWPKIEINFSKQTLKLIRFLFEIPTYEILPNLFLFLLLSMWGNCSEAFRSLFSYRLKIKQFRLQFFLASPKKKNAPNPHGLNTKRILKYPISILGSYKRVPNVPVIFMKTLRIFWNILKVLQNAPQVKISKPKYQIW